MRWFSLAAVAGIVITQVSCAVPSRDRPWLERSIVAHTGHSIGSRQQRERSAIPPGCSLADGLDPNEAVAIALWRSPSLHAELTALDTALADFDEARRIANPRLSLLAPIDPRQLAAILAIPIDALWQAPFRAAAANHELERVAESLVQIVLNVERDVRLAHADARFARARAQLMIERVTLWQSSLTLGQSRATHGENPLGEIAPLTVELGIAQDLAARAMHEVAINDARLLALMASDARALAVLVAPNIENDLAEPVETLVDRALRNRPDLRAAALAMHANGARAQWERSRVFALVATIDGQAPVRAFNPNFSIGLQMDLPLFSQNQGGIGRAEASIERASYQYAAMRIAVRLEVLSAYHSLVRARDSRVAFAAVLAATAESVSAARHAFEDGAESYFFVIDAQRRAQDAQLRMLELDAELAKSHAELSRAVGGLQAGAQS